VAVDDRVLAGEVGLVEVVCVPDVGATLAGIHDNGRVRTNEHGNTSSATSRASIALLVQRDVSSNYNGVAAVPGRRLHPVYRVEESVGSTVACVDGVNTLNVVVARLFEKLHENRLDRLGLVEQSLGTDFETTNALGVDVVLVEQRGDGGQGERVDVCVENMSVSPLDG
jgi:hypothetical protein